MYIDAAYNLYLRIGSLYVLYLYLFAKIKYWVQFNFILKQLTRYYLHSSFLMYNHYLLVISHNQHYCVEIGKRSLEPVPSFLSILLWPANGSSADTRLKHSFSDINTIMLNVPTAFYLFFHTFWWNLFSTIVLIFFSDSCARVGILMSSYIPDIAVGRISLFLTRV